MKPITVRWIVVAVLVAAVGAGVATQLVRMRGADLSGLDATVFDTARPFPDVALVDHTGKAFGRERLAGHWSLLFFGFTYCPDVCPTTLAMLRDVRQNLASLPAAQRPTIIFVSLDPRRDTPSRLAEYVTYFDPDFLGLTPREDDLPRLTQALGVTRIVVPGDSADDYAIDHTAAIYLFDPTGGWLGLFQAPHLPRHLADEYRRIVRAWRARH